MKMNNYVYVEKKHWRVYHYHFYLQNSQTKVALIGMITHTSILDTNYI